MDGFHLEKSKLMQMENPEEAFKRRGAPHTFDPLGLEKLLLEIRKNGEAKAPSFDHAIGDPVHDAIHITQE